MDTVHELARELKEFDANEYRLNLYEDYDADPSKLFDELDSDTIHEVCLSLMCALCLPKLDGESISDWRARRYEEARRIIGLYATNVVERETQKAYENWNR